MKTIEKKRNLKLVESQEEMDETYADFRGVGPRGYKRSDDRVYEEVCETLMMHPEVDAANIGVQVRDGVVWLSGYVENRGIKKIVESEIENISGVRDVQNSLMLIEVRTD